MDTFPDYESMTLEELFTQVCKCCEDITLMHHVRLIAKVDHKRFEELKDYKGRVLTESFDEIRRRVEVKGDSNA